MFVSKQFHDTTDAELYLGLDSQLSAVELTQNILLILKTSLHLQKGHINTSKPKNRKHEKMNRLLNSLRWTCFEYHNKGHKHLSFLMWEASGNCWDIIFLWEEMCHPREEESPHLMQCSLVPALLEIQNIGWFFHLTQAFVGIAWPCGELLVVSGTFTQSRNVKKHKNLPEKY